MKKLLALVICALLALGGCAALSEDAQEIGSINVNGAYKLTAKLPEGYQLEMTQDTEGYLRGTLSSSDPLKPAMIFSIAFDETYSDVERLNDLSDEDLAFLESTFGPGSEISYGETSEGTRLMFVRTADAQNEFLAVFTIYKGYMIEFDLFAGPGGKLSAEQESTAITFLSDMQFVPIEIPQ